MAKGIKKQKNNKQDNSENAQEKVVIGETKYKAVKSSYLENDRDKSSRSEEEKNPLSIKFNNTNLIEAIIYSEVLGKPRCKRRGRWR